jgi:hypothetical protein
VNPDAQARARAERIRLNELRRKVHAARIIQRNYRSYMFRRRLPRRFFKGQPVNRPIIKASPAPAHKPKNTREYTVHEQEIAALVIQLAWRQHARRMLKVSPEDRLIRRSVILRKYLAAARDTRLRMAYKTMVPQVHSWQPSLQSPTRTMVDIPSPAITSFNMAVSIYRYHCGDGIESFDPAQLLQSVNDRMANLDLSFPKMNQRAGMFPGAKPHATLVPDEDATEGRYRRLNDSGQSPQYRGSPTRRSNEGNMQGQQRSRQPATVAAV